MNKEDPSVIWWIPTLILLVVLWPMSFRWYTVYLEFGVPCLGIFFAWFTLRNLLKAKKNQQYIKTAAVYFLLMLIYNPLSYNFSLVSFMAQKNHTYLIVLNMVCAAVVLYMWWQEKSRKRN